MEVAKKYIDALCTSKQILYIKTFVSSYHLRGQVELHVCNRTLPGWFGCDIVLEGRRKEIRKTAQSTDWEADKILTSK